MNTTPGTVIETEGIVYVPPTKSYGYSPNRFETETN